MVILPLSDRYLSDNGPTQLRISWVHRSDVDPRRRCGTIEASNFYVTRTELHELLGRSFELAQHSDSAAAHYRKVVAAWSNGDPPFKARADTARKRLAALGRS